MFLRSAAVDSSACNFNRTRDCIVQHFISETRKNLLVRDPDLKLAQVAAPCSKGRPCWRHPTIFFVILLPRFQNFHGISEKNSFTHSSSKTSLDKIEWRLRTKSSIAVIDCSQTEGQAGTTDTTTCIFDMHGCQSDQSLFWARHLTPKAAHTNRILSDDFAAPLHR